MRERRLFKTLRLRKDVDANVAAERLGAVLASAGIAKEEGSIDRVEIDAYLEDETLMVASGARLERLLDASPVLRGLSREAFVHYRAIFPPEARAAVRAAFADLADLT